MAKLKLFRKDGMKRLPQVALSSAIRGGGAVGTAFLIKKITTPGTSGKPILEPKYAGAAAFLVGTLGEAFIEQPQLSAAFQGMATFGAVHATANMLMPDQKEKLGLAGLAAPQPNVDQKTAETNWNEFVDEALRIADEQAAAAAAVSTERQLPQYTEDAPDFTVNGIETEAALSMV